MRRRDVLHLGLAAAAFPAFVRAPKAVAKAGGWRPPVFDGHQKETVIAPVDPIVPETDTPGRRRR